MIQNGKEKSSAGTGEYSVEELIEKAKSFYKYLKKHRLKTLAAGILCALLGIAVASFKKPIYVARMTFAIHQQKSSGGLGGALSSTMAMAALGGSSTGIYAGSNIIPFLSSRLMIQKTLLSTAEFENGKKQLLVNRYIKAKKLDAKWKKSKYAAVRNLAFYEDKPTNRTQDSVLGEIFNEFAHKTLSIDRLDKRTSLIVLEFSDKDELFAKRFVEKLTDNAMDFYIKSTTKKSQDNVDKLQRQADSVRGVIDRAISGVATSVDATPNANPLRQVLKVSSQRRMLDVETNRGALVEINKNLGMARIALTQDTPLIDFLDQPILPLDVMRLSKITGGVLGFLFGVGISVVFLTFKKFASKF
ncbi:MAG: lipopolysaccharide biosynthesis protein [Sphingobacteriaceae bacterium]|nr:MAG: lipopolysaccharide biosynthesis protein [Sphingobacteriaceae bacterium]